MEVKIADATVEDATNKQHVITVLVSGQQKETLNESNNILSKLHKVQSLILNCIYLRLKGQEDNGSTSKPYNFFSDFTVGF